MLAFVDENEKPWDGVYENVDTLMRSPLVTDPTEEATNEYFKTIQQFCWHRYGYYYIFFVKTIMLNKLNREENKNSKLKIVFTPMHGVGKPWTARAFEAFSLSPYIPVLEQIEPDPDFPTVPFPNPEEGKGKRFLNQKNANANT